MRGELAFTNYFAPPMSQAQVKMRLMEVTPDVFLAEPIHLGDPEVLPPHPVEQPELVLVFAWMGASHVHLQKYTDSYRSLVSLQDLARRVSKLTVSLVSGCIHHAHPIPARRVPSLIAYVFAIFLLSGSELTKTAQATHDPPSAPRMRSSPPATTPSPPAPPPRSSSTPSATVARSS